MSYNSRSVTELKKISGKLPDRNLYQKFILDSMDEDIDLSNAQWSVLDKAVEQLSPQKRKVWDLCKMQGKTYEQAALESGISKHIVKEYLSDAAACIRKYVQQHQEQYAFLITTAFIAIFFFKLPPVFTCSLYLYKQES